MLRSDGKPLELSMIHTAHCGTHAIGSLPLMEGILSGVFDHKNRCWKNASHGSWKAEPTLGSTSLCQGQDFGEGTCFLHLGGSGGPVWLRAFPPGLKKPSWGAPSLGWFPYAVGSCSPEHSQGVGRVPGMQWEQLTGSQAWTKRIVFFFSPKIIVM